MSDRDRLRRQLAKKVESLERSIFEHLFQSLADWLGRVLDRVLVPFRKFGVLPDPTAVWSLTPEWNHIVDHIVSDHLDAVARDGWQLSHGRTAYVSGNSFVQAQLAHTRNLLVRIPDDVYNLVFAELSDGTNAGDSIEDIAERVEKVLSTTRSENWRNRAMTIARTETIRAYNAGALGSGLRTQDLEGAPMAKEWLATEDKATRPSHREADGQQRLLLEPFRVGGSSLQFPVDPLAAPEEVINCVPGSARVRVIGVQAIYRFSYTGPLVTLAGEHGLISTVSPNHPVLTERGWIPAVEVQQGDYLVTAIGGNDFTGTKPNIESNDISAQKIYDSVALPGTGYGVDGLAVDFHGDIPDGKVQVVFPNRELSFGINASLLEEVEKFFFSCANAPAAGGSPMFQLSVRPTDPPGGSMGFFNLISALVWGHATPLQRLRLALCAPSDAGSFKAALDGRSTDTEDKAKCRFGLSGQVALRKIIDVKLNEAHDVFLYTFATSSGIYIADDIISHNCRCTMIIKEA